MKEHAQEGVPERWPMLDDGIPEATGLLSSWEHLHEIRPLRRVMGHMIVTDKGAMFTIRRSDGKVSFEFLRGEDVFFMNWASDLFRHKWQ